MDEPRIRPYPLHLRGEDHEDFNSRYRLFQQAWADAEAQRPSRWRWLRRLAWWRR